MSRASLDSIFEPVTEIVNIAHEVPANALSIRDRVRIWLAQSDSHVYIGRGSDWGNPYSDDVNSAAEFIVASREDAIAKYRAYIQSRPDLMARLGALRGKRLGCWCKPKWCHGDVILELIYGQIQTAA